MNNRPSSNENGAPLKKPNANRLILRSLFVVTGFLLVGKLMAAGKDVSFAYRYGVGEVLDIYTLAMVIVTWLPLLIVGMLQSVMIPIITAMDEGQRAVFHRQVLTVVCLVGAIFTALTWILGASVVPFMASGFSEVQQAELVDVVNILLPVVLLTCVIALFSSELLARGNHANTLLEGLPSLVLLVLVLLWDAKSFVPLLWGTLIGSLLQLLFLMALFHRKYQKIRFTAKLSNPAWSQFAGGAFILFLGTLASSSAMPFDQYFAGQMGEGAVSTLSYATRLLSLGTGLAITVVGRAILPVLCQPGITESVRSSVALRWSNGLLACGIVAMLIAWPVAEFAVGLIYQRGEFLPSDTIQVSGIVQIGLLQLPFLFGSMVYVQYFSSRRLFKIIAYSGIVALLVKIVSASLLVDWYGLDGVMYSTILMQVASLVYFAVMHTKVTVSVDTENER